MKYQALVAFECSGKTRNALRNNGIDAWSVDILPSYDESPYHIVGDAFEEIKKGGTLLIAHPPCTYLSNSGIHLINKEDGRLERMTQAAYDLQFCLNAPFDHIVVENPIPHRHALMGVSRKYDQIIQPWQFGHGETKATCLWLKNLPLLKPTNIVPGREARIYNLGPSKDRQKKRSETYQGIADAFADQYGPYSITDLFGGAA